MLVPDKVHGNRIVSFQTSVGVKIGDPAFAPVVVDTHAANTTTLYDHTSYAYNSMELWALGLPDGVLDPTYFNTGENDMFLLPKSAYRH